MTTEQAKDDAAKKLYAAKIAEAYREVLAGQERQVEKHFAVARLLVEARASFDRRGQWTPFVKDKLPFGIRKAEMYLEIGAVFDPNAQDLAALARIFPPHFTLIHALAKLDEREGEGTLARAIGEGLINPDMTLDEINDIAEDLEPAPQESRVEEAATAPVMAARMPKQKSKALVAAEARNATLQREIQYQREARFKLSLDSIFVRSSVACNLCGEEYWLKSNNAQADITLWIKIHIEERHPGERDFLSVRYVIDRRMPPVEVAYCPTKAESDEVRELFPNFAPNGIQLMLPPAPPEVVAATDQGGG